ncbi:MAG: HEAT repeat domain-containing protein [Verrucomicrobiae bacterium]|nr:HEAT repeat domain-containing protein [Verrucomicrobiae bacterium]
MNRSSIASLAASLIALLAALPTLAAEPPYASAEQARQALSILQSSAPPSEKAVACKRLAVYGGPEAVPALANLLSDPQLASWARIPLEVIPGPEADLALRQALSRLNGNLLAGVINSIGVRQDALAVDPLILHLQDPNTEVANAAAIALGRIASTPAVAALEAALASTPSALRSSVAEALILAAESALDQQQPGQASRLFHTVRQANVPLQRQLEATRGAILAQPASGLPLLLDTLRNPLHPAFAMGLRTARELPGQPVTEALAAELYRLPDDRQSLLLLALADRRDDAVAPAILGAVNRGSTPLRLAAISTLERQGSADAIPALLQAGVDPQPDVAQAAQSALTRLPGDAIDRALAARLPQASGPTRLLLVSLAGQRRIAEAVPELLQSAQSDNPQLRRQAIQALGEASTAAHVGPLADLLLAAPSEEELEDLETALDTACDRISDKAGATAPLLSRLANAEPEGRAALLRILGTTATPGGLRAVHAHLAHPDESVRDTAFRVLAAWRDPAAIPALVQVLRSPAQPVHQTLALRGAVRLLAQGNLAPAQRLPAYRDLLALAQRPDDRKLILSGLGSVPDPDAIPVVQPLLADPSIRTEAESALLSIATHLTSSAPAQAEALAKQLKASSTDASIRDQAARVLERLDQYGDYITAWQFAGAYTLFAGEGGSLFAREFPPERDDPSVQWQPLPAGTQAHRPWMMDLLATGTGPNRCAGYARTWVHSAVAQPAQVELGADDGHKLWCNGEPVSQANRGGAAVPGEFKTIVSLRQGWNLLLLKITQDTGPWEFCLRLRTSTGERLEGLKISAAPPESASH